MDRCVVDVSTPCQNAIVTFGDCGLGLVLNKLRLSLNVIRALQARLSIPSEIFKFGDEWLVSFSKVPLRLSIYMGYLLHLFCINGFFDLYWRLFHPSSALTGLTIVRWRFSFGCGTVGEYWDFGPVYRADLRGVKGRPLYTLARVAGLAIATIAK